MTGPGALITAEIFDGDNYHLWEKAIRTALKLKNKLRFTDGALKKPEIKKTTLPSTMLGTW